MIVAHSVDEDHQSRVLPVAIENALRVSKDRFPVSAHLLGISRIVQIYNKLVRVGALPWSLSGSSIFSVVYNGVGIKCFGRVVTQNLGIIVITLESMRNNN